MFDNMNRYFSRKGSDRDDIETNSAVLDSMRDYEETRKPEPVVERDIDAVEIDAPVIEERRRPADDEEAPQDEILSVDDIITSVKDGDADDDDDFESIWFNK